MKKKRLFCIVIAIFAVMCMVFSACSSAFDDPKQLIRDTYGDTEFTISFNSAGMDEALDTVQYTANSVPKLPTPTRLGYIFEGWYFDREYTMPYSDMYLLLYMCDVTLYAKWSKEEMVQDGIYEIGFSASIVEGSIRNEGPLVSKYGYINFCDAIIEEETYIEKAGDEIFLKLQYDAGYVVPISSQPVFSLAVLSPYSVQLSAEKTIDSAADSVKTLYFDIGPYVEQTEMNEPIYFTVVAYNWEAEGLTIDERAQTNITYTVEFTITEFAGFSQPYVNTDTVLDDGYYLVESYYMTLSGEESMGNSFNPVYSYLCAEGGNYTLIKPFSPYIGMMTSASEFINNVSNFFDRGTAFSAAQLWYGIEIPDNLSLSGISYYPEYLKGSEYGGYAIEYHADTGKFYSIYNFESTLYSHLVINAAMSGPMEYMGGMGTVELVVELDLDHVLRLAEIDYEPLEGDAYQYADKVQTYAGNLSDLNSYNLTYDAVEEHGLSTDFINFFWSAASSSSAYSDRTVHSSRITFSAQSDTAGIPTAESRYRIAHFDVVAEVYGYDCTGNDLLFADITTSGTFGGIALRDTKQIITGVSNDLQEGSTVNLLQIYNSKVDPNFSGSIGTSGTDVTYSAYALDDSGIPDYRSSLSVAGSSFIFSRDMAIVFVHNNGTGIETTTVILQKEQEPEISIQEGTYSEDALYLVGDAVTYPIVTYSWLGNTKTLYGSYYLTSEAQNGVHHEYVGLYDVTDSAAGESTYSLNYISNGQTTFTMTSENMCVVYVLENRFGEIQCIYYSFAAESGDWQLTSDGELISSGTVSNGDDGTREIINITDNNTGIISNSTDLQAALDREYTLIFGNTDLQMDMEDYRILTRNQVYAGTSKENLLAQMDAVIENCPYAYLEITYANSYGDNFVKQYMFGVSFNGISVDYMYAAMFGYSNIFSNYTYSGRVPDLISLDMIDLGEGSLGAIRVTGYSESASGVNLNGDALTFTRTGTYRVYYTYTLTYDANGDRIFADYNSITLTFSKYIEVVDGAGEVKIIYHTDEEHPFLPAFDADGDNTYTVLYNLGAESSVSIINSQYFIATSDHLFGWTTDPKYTYRDIDYIYSAGERVQYISSFHSAEIHLYPIWDEGLSVTAELSMETEDAYVINLSTNTNSVIVYLGTSFRDNGRYVVSLTSFQVNGLSSNYELIGWTVNGEFVPTAEVENYSYITYENSPITIVAEIRRIFTVSYSIDRTYSTTFFQPTTAYEGEYITLPWAVTLNDPENYRLVGWNVMIDGEYVMEGEEYLLIEDVSEYAINGNVTFVAVFGTIGD